MTTDQRAGSARRIPQLIPHRLLRSKAAHHPAVLEEAERRSRNFQLRLADRITTFAGSMNFVWIHAALFAVWMLFLEKSPWPSLTLVVSLEAIFLSAFVMIGQNRQAAFQQAKADHDFEAQDLELKTNTDLHVKSICSQWSCIGVSSTVRRPTYPIPRRLHQTAMHLEHKAQFGEALRARKPSFEVMVIRARPHQD